jgi:hypothetical protein
MKNNTSIAQSSITQLNKIAIELNKSNQQLLQIVRKVLKLTPQERIRKALNKVV